MPISQFLAQHMTRLRAEIINNLNSPFDSHEFIRKFTKKFEADYISFVNAYGRVGAFREIHRQMALFLRRNEATLGIIGMGKVESPNIFGNVTEVERWKKL